MRVEPTYWDPPSCEGLCDCCDGVVYESNPFSIYLQFSQKIIIFFFINYLQILKNIKTKGLTNAN
jgi:hypothetical protein